MRPLYWKYPWLTPPHPLPSTFFSNKKKNNKPTQTKSIFFPLLKCRRCFQHRSYSSHLTHTHLYFPAGNRWGRLWALLGEGLCDDVNPRFPIYGSEFNMLEFEVIRLQAFLSFFLLCFFETLCWILQHVGRSHLKSWCDSFLVFLLQTWTNCCSLCSQIWSSIVDFYCWHCAWILQLEILSRREKHQVSDEDTTFGTPQACLDVFEDDLSLNKNDRQKRRTPYSFILFKCFSPKQKTFAQNSTQ